MLFPARRRALLASLFCVVFLLKAPLAQAHPHIWITAAVSFIFEDGKLTALRQAWVFDDFFSASLIQDFDKDKNGMFDADEQQALGRQAFAALRDSDYFSRLRQGGASFPVKNAEDFSATQAKGLVVYGFTLPLATPIDPGAGPITAGIYDDSFFVDIEFDEADPVRFDGIPSGACSYAIREDPADAIYGGLVIPPSATVTCRTP